MSRLLELPEGFRLRRQHTLFDDFDWLISPHLWTVTATDAGVTSQTDAANGIVTFAASDGTVADNDEIYLLSTKEVWKFADDKPVMAEGRCKFTEANTDDANAVLVGLADAVAANTILDDGGGLKASFSGAAIYKVDGETAWRVISSVGTTRTVTLSGKSSVSTGYQVGRIEVKPYTAALAAVTFYVDNGDGTGSEQLKDAVTGLVIQHTLDMTSATEMQLFVGMKNGGANLETLFVDYLGASQLR